MMESTRFGLTNTNVSYTTPALMGRSQPYMREDQIALKVLTPTWPCIILFGLISNMINIIVFWKAGVKDNVTTLLLSLSMSDLAFLILVTPNTCYWIINYYRDLYVWPFHYRFIHTLFYWPAFTAYDLSAFISVSLGVVRCACVAMPLKFKAVFTRSRTIKWVSFLVVLAVSLHVPVLSIYKIVWKRDTVANVSYPYLVGTNRAQMSRINDIMNRGFVIWINYIVMVTCVCILSRKLYSASRLRSSLVVESSQSCDQGPNKTAARGMSRDLQVIKSVVLVCSIFILSQLPYMALSLNRLIDKEFNINDSRLMNLFSIVSNVARTCSFLNASVNIFVYYNCNTKYRFILLTLVASRETS